MSYIMALDAGTTSARCILFDHSGTICAMAQRELANFFPQEGWVEQDAEEIWQTQLQVCREAMAQLGVDGTEIAAIGIADRKSVV